MKILQIVPNSGWGGGEKYVYELSDSLSRAGHDVRVVIPPCDIQREKFAPLGPEVIRFRGHADPVAIVRLSRLMKEQQPEIVHVHIFKHALAVALARKWSGVDARIVMTRHLAKPSKKKPYYPWLYGEIDKMIFVSEKAQAVFLSSDPPIGLPKLAVIPNSIRIPGTAQATVHTSGPVLRIGFAGAVTPAKGIEFLMAIAQQLKKRAVPARFIVAGKGDPEYVEELSRRIRHEGLEPYMELAGFIDDCVSFFGSADLAIVPSTAPEAFPLVTLEAMAAGRPVLWSQFVPEEIMDEGIEGIRIDCGDPEGTARRIEALARDRELLQEWGENARRRFDERYAYPIFLERMTDIYREVLTPDELLEHPPLD